MVDELSAILNRSVCYINLYTRTKYRRWHCCLIVCFAVFCVHKVSLPNARNKSSGSLNAQPSAHTIEAGSFREHLVQWPGFDWELYYRINGNHFGNPLISIPQGV
jgi:hypothetical protein